MTRPKDIGTKFETACVKIFTEAGFKARRLALSGNKDVGDVELKTGDATFVVECKAHKTFGRTSIANWRKQAVTEAYNYAKAYNEKAAYVLIVSQYGKSNDDSFVHLVLGGAWVMMYLNEFIALLKSKKATSWE